MTGLLFGDGHRERHNALAFALWLEGAVSRAGPIGMSSSWGWGGAVPWTRVEPAWGQE